MLSAELKVRFFEALDREGGSVSAAARVVGMNRNTAYAWARKAGMRGQGTPGGRGGHPGRAEYDRLRSSGVRRREAAAQVGIHERTLRTGTKGSGRATARAFVLMGVGWITTRG